jgi:endonuclease/exonuclease/phosphatase family metal-dependent hydrolase
MGFVMSELRTKTQLVLVLLLAGCGVDPGIATDGPGIEPSTSATRVRIVAANLTSGNYSSYDPGHGARILTGIDADVVLIQELNVGDNTDAELAAWVEQTFGPGFSYSRPNPSAQLPNGVISRWPILASGLWDDPEVSNRDFAWARVDLPGPRELWAVSLHLLTANATTRNREASRLLEYINSQVPDEDYLVVGGDLNTRSFSESCLSTLAARVETSGPHPADQNGNTATNATRSRPYDHVLVDADLAALQTSTQIGASSFPNGLVVDTRVYVPLSDIAPARWDDSAVFGVQHMAVVKDFLIDGVSPPPPPPPLSPVVMINEILANEPGSDTGAEFVEIVNAGTEPVDLAEWTLSDRAALRHTFAAGEVVQPGQAIVVFGRLQNAPPDLASARGASSGALGLSNGGDQVSLHDASGELIAQVTYSSALSGSDGVSMTRTVDGDASADLVLHTSLSALTSSPGQRYDGTAFGGGSGNPLVFLNEVLANEPGSDTAAEFVELLNAGDAAADLGSWSLADNSGTRHVFAPGTSLAPGAALVVFARASGIPAGLDGALAASSGALGFSNGGDTVTLADETGATVDSLAYGATTDGISFNRDPDGTADAPWALHTEVGASPSSPGTRADGTPF